MKKDLIFLIGFMTAGKTTLGKILANTIGWDFVDLDQEIEKLENKSVVQIFKDYGEDFFRTLESQILNNYVKKSNYVISLGGGTIENPKNFQLIFSKGITICLNISVNEAIKRLKYKRNRPVLFNNINEVVSDSELIERVSKIYNRRVHLYNQADIIIDTDKTSVANSVDYLAKLLKRKYRIE